MSTSLLQYVKQAYHAIYLENKNSHSLRKNREIIVAHPGPEPLSVKDIRWSIEKGRCFVNGSIERFCSKPLSESDRVRCWLVRRPLWTREASRILYEDETLLAYNKPPFITSEELAQLLGVQLIHRLDRDTTGVILFAKQNPKRFETLFRERKVHKTYHALVDGAPKAQGSVSVKLGVVSRRQGAVLWGITPDGLWSQTDWFCEGRGPKQALLRCHPVTGRTHQIRIHMKACSHPIMGDDTYGSRIGRAGIFRPLLHATQLELPGLSLQAPFPEDFLAVMSCTISSH